MQAILQQLQEKGVENIQEKIAEKQAQYYNLLTQEAAVRLIARENGIKAETEAPKPRTSLIGLSVGSRVSNVFKIAYFSEPKVFSNEKRSGLLLALGLKAAEGECTVVVWNQEARKILASELSVNSTIQVSDALVKNVNPLEIHADLLTKIEPCENSGIPNRTLKEMGIENIAAGSEDLIATSGFLTNVGEVKKFAKKNGAKNAEGKLSRCVITSANLSIPLVCWGEYAELVKEFEKGTQLLLTDVKVKQNKLSNSIELHTTNSTRLLAGKEKDPQAAQKAHRKISELKEGENVEVECQVEELKEVKTVKMCEKCFAVGRGEMCQCGGKTQETVVAEATLADSSGKINCSFFDSRALQLLEMKSISPDIANTVGELKKEKLKGKNVKLVINAKFNNFLNQLTANCRQVL